MPSSLSGSFDLSAQWKPTPNMENIEDILRGHHHIQSKSLFILHEVLHESISRFELFLPLICNVLTTIYDEISCTNWAGGR